MQTKIIKIDPAQIEEKKIMIAVEVLSKGGLVIVPTDTVYGIIANSHNPDAVERLYAVKQRPSNKSFTIVIERKERIEEFNKNLNRLVYKLIDKFWPGPLTVVIPDRKNNKTLGLRMPNYPFLLKLISRLDFPLCCPSANLSGKKPPRTLQEALIDLDGKVDLAIDGADTPLGVESTIVDLSNESFSILREAAIPAKEVEEALNKKIVLFVCTGNSCRSVMAEGLLKKKLEQMGKNNVEVISAGIAMIDGLRPTFETLQLLKEEGIDFSQHVSQRITPLLIKKADLILVMESIHEDKVKELVPSAENNLFLLKEFAKINKGGNLEIPDPIGRSFGEYKIIFNIIKEAVERIANIL